jgi:regulator of protease activity HflC (stomatin/prohibitin superfamily)
MRIGILVTGAAIAAVFIAGLMWGLPQYGVWQQELAGRAELVRAEQNRRIAVLEAQARLEAEELNAQAEITRAHGVAEANAIVAEGLGGPEGYLRYLWIQSLGENGQDVIYIPTEAGLPILEASRHIAQ